MKPALVTGVLACTIAVTAVAGGEVDREKLKRVVDLPTVGENWWFYGFALDGRVLEGGETAQLVDVAALAADLAGNETDAERWMDLAAACRRDGDVAQSEHAISKAVAIFRDRCAALPDDGRPRAALGLALVASGDDRAGQQAIDTAANAKHAAWASEAASADLLVLRAAGLVAGCRFGALSEAFDWLGDHEDSVKWLDATLLADAAIRYDKAVEAVEKSGAIGSEASSVYVRRMKVVGLRMKDDSAPSVKSSEFDIRKAAAMQPSEPYAVLLNALDDAMSEPDAEGTRHVERFAMLSDRARADVIADFARLREMAASPDAVTAGRALQAIACLQWFCRRDPSATVETLRLSIEKAPSLRQSWGALTMVLAQTSQGDALVEVCRNRIAKTGESASKRLQLGKALWRRGNDAEAEKEWRAGLSLAPKDVVANLGAAVFVIRRAKDDAELREAAEFVRAAKEASTGTKDSSIDASCRLWSAVLLGLTGDVDGAEKIARSLAADFPEWQPGKDLLAALGR